MLRTPLTGEARLRGRGKERGGGKTGGLKRFTKKSSSGVNSLSGHTWRLLLNACFSPHRHVDAYLGGMVNDRRDLLGVALEGGHNLLLILVKHHHVLIRATCKARPHHRWVSVDDGETDGWVVVFCGWMNSEQSHSPVSTLLVSEGHRSRARIPGTLALCRP